MIERGAGTLDRTYTALAHPIRRAILERLRTGDLRVTDVAGPFSVSLAAASKHIRVPESAGLVSRTGRRPRSRAVLRTASWPRPETGPRRATPSMATVTSTGRGPRWPRSLPTPTTRRNGMATTYMWPMRRVGEPGCRSATAAGRPGSRAAPVMAGARASGEPQGPGEARGAPRAPEGNVGLSALRAGFRRPRRTPAAPR